jgi:hypothetical protein
MSRARGRMYADEDLDVDDEDDDYDDGYRQFASSAAKGKGGGGAKGPATPARPQSAAQGGGGKGGDTPARPTPASAPAPALAPAPPPPPPPADEYPDADLLDAGYDAVAECVGGDDPAATGGIGEADIVAALRAGNYAPEAAVAWLLDGGRAPRLPPPPVVAKPAPGPAKTATPARPTSGGSGKAAGGAATPLAGAATPGGSAAATGPAPLPPVPAVVEAALADAASKPRVAIVTAGHVDAGKSTLMGHLLVDTGCVCSGGSSIGCGARVAC